MHPTSALPRILTYTAALIGGAPTDAAGALWHLDGDGRELDANVVAVPAGGEIGRHEGADLDVLILVLDGSGELQTAGETIALRPGVMVWLPRRSERRFVGGADGVRYFTVHRRKPGLSITRATPGDRS